MDPPWAANQPRGPSPAIPSRLPTKKNSFHSLRETAANGDRRSFPLSPGAVSDTSSGTDTGNGSQNGSQSGFAVPFNSSRRYSSGSQSDTRGRSATHQPGQTRIPRPSPSQKLNSAARKPMTIMEAHQKAQEEAEAFAAAAAQGSPSPAPRPWRTQGSGSARTRGTPTPANPGGSGPPLSASESRMQRILTRSPLNVGGTQTARRLGESFPPGERSPLQRRANNGDNNIGIAAASNARNAARSSMGLSERGKDADLRRIQYEEDLARMKVAIGERTGGLFSPKARVSPKIAVAGRELHRRASNSSLGEKNKASTSGAAATAAAARASLPGSGRQTSWGNRSKPESAAKRLVSAPEKLAANAPVHADTGDGNDGDDGRGTGLVVATRAEEPPTLLPAAADAARDSRSPNKSFAWDADADFTAGDLMFSESPPVKTGEGLGITNGTTTTRQQETPRVRPRNSKLDEIRQLEIEAVELFPDEPTKEPRVDPVNQADEDEPIILTRPPAESGDESDTQYRHQSQRRTGLPAERTNKALDEIRELENENIFSKRAIAAAKLDEIRQQNAEYRAGRAASRAQQQPSGLADGKTDETSGKEDNDRVTVAHDEKPTAKGTILAEESEQTSNTPVTIFRATSTDRGRNPRRLFAAAAAAATDDNDKSNDSDKTTKSGGTSPNLHRESSSSHSRNESQELLRRLARVTTAVVAASERDEHGVVTHSMRRLSEKTSSDSLRGALGVDAAADRPPLPKKLPKSRDAGETLRPSVGFASGLRRVSSSESASTKRSSVAQSDGDPIDRIEAEMKLFAPVENHSERGSIRAPSPDADEDPEEKNTTAARKPETGGALANDATPRPAKVTNNPLLLQPTPRVTGAYVETPVTAKTEKMLEAIGVTGPTSSSPSEKPVMGGLDAPAAKEPAASSNADTGDKTNGEPATATTKNSMPRRRSSAALRRSRSRSASRALFNSAKPTSARDDLLAIQQAQQIDDSTLDNFDEMLQQPQAAATASKTQASSFRDGQHHGDTESDETFCGLEDAEVQRLLDDARNGAAGGEADAADAERLKRMNQSIKTYLTDVQTMKRGIERLEAHVSHPENSSASHLKLEETDGEQEEQRTATRGEKQEATRAVKKVKEQATTGKPIKKEEREQPHSRTAPPLSVADAKKTAPATTAVPVAYVQLPVPRLYRREPHAQLTLLGVLVLLVSVWLAAEGTTCALFCRPDACQSGQDCTWSPDDPSFGTALPVKLDQWLTGGRGRQLATWAGDELGDLAADAWDAVAGVDIRHVDPTYFTFEEKRRHRRRLQKKGLVRPWTPPVEALPKLKAWRLEREALEQERARQQRLREELGYDEEEEEEEEHGDKVGGVEDQFLGSESMAADEQVHGSWW
ncbi:hypothetical protein SPI_09229 [Niveomyces insectorum RCEF 264]|uniref:Uncharacterized protein n=1 Tax=Niveomyces insectorum RCEF 264 TaxID=1081102 RepID=A0A167M118_9HYPO|nr:hypothetical protein SPI_09229 [Niveomyces insectorum RCEF 264]